MIVLDTHALIWLDEGHERLGKKARVQIDKALQNNILFVCSISFWEVSMLLQKGRLEMTLDIEDWRGSLLGSGLQEIPLTGETAILAGQLKSFHGDPADRIITASTMLTSSVLCTADKKLLGYKKNLKCLDAGK